MDKILSLLRENSQLSYSEIATMINEPEDYVEKQIKQYEKDGVIRGYRAVIDYDKVKNSGARAFIELKVQPKKDTGFDEVAKQVMSFDEVETVYLMAGSFDLLVRVKGESVTDIAMFVAKRLSTLDGVLATNTHFQLRTYKDSGMVLFDEENDEDQRSIIL
ncbi:MAG: Lrp/AsnC family transcriptional regulator [Clostridia bacterium]|nr:Lrp/AsnC family transcriptional regulator [Clostridia bacterium]